MTNKSTDTEKRKQFADFFRHLRKRMIPILVTVCEGCGQRIRYDEDVFDHYSRERRVYGTSGSGSWHEVMVKMRLCKTCYIEALRREIDRRESETQRLKEELQRVSED